MRLPYFMSWSGGFQWGFRQNWVFEMVYQGQSGVGLLNNWDMNGIPLNISSDPAVLNHIFTQTQNFKPYPPFGAVNLFSNFGHNSYHSATWLQNGGLANHIVGGWELTWTQTLQSGTR